MHCCCYQMVEFVGLSGPINFDTSGLRTNFEMDLMELQRGGLVSKIWIFLFHYHLICIITIDQSWLLEQS